MEFALVLPALAALMFGTVQAGLLAFSYNMMVSAARDETRAMAVCSTDPTTAETDVLGKLPPWIAAGNWTVTADNTAPNATMTISIPTSLAMVVSYVPFDLPTLTTTITMLQEPTGYGGGSCSAATAAVVAVVLPAITATAGAGIDVAYLESDIGHLQAAADAGSTAGRQYLNPFQPTDLQASDLVNNAVQFANENYASTLVADDVVQGWWDVKAKTFGPPIAGQTTQYDGNYFSNAVQVTTRTNHVFLFGQLLGVTSMPLARQSGAYKCSNTNYPLTLIPDDPNPPALPAIWASFAADGHDASQSYYYANPRDGNVNPVFKFYVPWDGTDVSFVIKGSNGDELQVDSYCKGTFLVVPDAFNTADPGQGWNPNVTWQIYRGSTNDSFDIYPDQQDYPMEFSTTTYNTVGAQQISYLTNPDVKILLTDYPTRDLGWQWWASAGDPTPARRAIMVQ